MIIFILGLVTATFAASLITSPAIGAHLARLYSENFVIALGIFLLFLFFYCFVYLGTVVAIVDLIFIFFVVPESLPERFRTDQKVSWDKIDPFAVSFVSFYSCKNYYWNIFRLFEILHMIVLFFLYLLLSFYLIFPVRNHKSNLFVFISFGYRSRTVFMFFCLPTISKFCLDIEINECIYIFIVTWFFRRRNSLFYCVYWYFFVYCTSKEDVIDFFYRN
jgi:hypothetical protein